MEIHDSNVAGGLIGYIQGTDVKAISRPHVTDPNVYVPIVFDGDKENPSTAVFENCKNEFKIDKGSYSNIRLVGTLYVGKWLFKNCWNDGRLTDSVTTGGYSEL